MMQLVINSVRRSLLIAVVAVVAFPLCVAADEATSKDKPASAKNTAAKDTTSDKDAKSADENAEVAKLEVGEQAPEFKIKDGKGKLIDLAELTAEGPVL